MADPTLDSADAPALTGRPHKRVRWRRPGGNRRPGVLDATRAELVRGLEQRQGSMWLRVSRSVSIAGYPLANAFERVRALRSDGAESLLAMTVALLYLADVRTGFVGKPRASGGPWQRYTLHDLAQLAYGGQSEADIRRARRALDMMVSLGWASPTKQTRRHIGEGQYRSDAGVRRINFDRICKLAGTSWLLSRDRQHADRTRGAGTVDLDSRRNRRSGGKAPTHALAAAQAAQGDLTRLQAALAGGVAPAPHESPPGHTGPPARAADASTALAAIGDIFKLLSDG